MSISKQVKIYKHKKGFEIKNYNLEIKFYDLLIKLNKNICTIKKVIINIENRLLAIGEMDKAIEMLD